MIAIKSLLALVLILAALAFGTGYSHGASPNEVPRIALLLSSGSAPLLKSNVEAFVEELQKLGYIEGKTAKIEYLDDLGRPDLWVQLAASAVQLGSSIVVTSGPYITVTAKDTIKTIPIVMVDGGGNPVDRGLVKSRVSPGGNVTGLSATVEGMHRKRLELFKEAVPSISRVAVLLQRSGGARSGKAKMNELQTVGASLKMDIRPVIIQSVEELQKGFASTLAMQPDAFIALAPGLTERATEITAFSIKNRLPSMYETRVFAEQGGMMSFGVDWQASWRRAAVFVDKILKGAKPGDLPVEPPPKLELVINLQTAQKIGVTISPEILLEANKVIK